MNSDFQFKWDLLNMYLGNDYNDNENNDYKKEEQKEEDRPYSKKKLKQCSMLPNIFVRVKIIVSLLSSSGLRHGAVNILLLKDLEKIEKYNIYQVTAYHKSKKYNYKTFCYHQLYI
ncbi:MAG TPA: hypothetical protein VF047_04820 [Nitrososphaeraceae archaeon]